MNWNLRLISLQLVKIYNIDGFYGVNHPVKNSLNFRHPPKEGNIESPVVILDNFIDNF